MSELKAIIFDMDGVLIDSVNINNISLNRVLKEDYGVEVPLNVFKKYLGRSLKDQLKAWSEDLGIPENVDLMAFSKRAFVYQMETLSKDFKEDKYLINLINEAKSKGIKIGVGTSSTKYRAIELLKLVGVYDALDAFVAQDDIIKHKPDPEVFLTVAKQLEEQPENCVVIEDAVNGLQAAKAANMKSVAKLTEFHKIQDLKEYTQLVFSNFSELNLKKLSGLF